MRLRGIIFFPGIGSQPMRPGFARSCQMARFSAHVMGTLLLFRQRSFGDRTFSQPWVEQTRLIDRSEKIEVSGLPSSKVGEYISLQIILRPSAHSAQTISGRSLARSWTRPAIHAQIPGERFCLPRTCLCDRSRSSTATHTFKRT